MGQERLNALSMLYCHTDIDISPEEIIEQFAQRHPRRMSLVNLDYMINLITIINVNNLQYENFKYANRVAVATCAPFDNLETQS